MTTIAFDTYKLTPKLKSRSFSEEQALGVNEAIMEIDLTALASKADVQEVNNALRATEATLRSQMREMEYRIIVRVGGMLFLGFGFLAAIKFLG